MANPLLGAQRQHAYVGARMRANVAAGLAGIQAANEVINFGINAGQALNAVVGQPGVQNVAQAVTPLALNDAVAPELQGLSGARGSLPTPRRIKFDYSEATPSRRVPVRERFRPETPAARWQTFWERSNPESKPTNYGKRPGRQFTVYKGRSKTLRKRRHYR